MVLVFFGFPQVIFIDKNPIDFHGFYVAFVCFDLVYTDCYKHFYSPTLPGKFGLYWLFSRVFVEIR
jgi:hypothetical protein